MTITEDRSTPSRVIELADLYRDLHRHPELAFGEHRTAAVLARELARLGFVVHTGVGGTGVAGVLRRGAGPVVLLRAELDALPLTERTGVPFAADPGTSRPAMHACGHDLHLCWLIGACRIFAAEPVGAGCPGTIVVVGQPAEETGQGAAAMINDGLFERVPVPDVLLALHVSPAPVGTVGTAPGPLLAASDTVDIQFHAGVRDRLADPADPARLAAGLITRLPDPTAGSPDSATTVAVTAIAAGDPAQRQSLTPDTATVRLVLRSPHPAARERARRILERKAQAEAAVHDAPAPQISWHSAIPAVVNDARSTRLLTASLRRALGEQAVTIIPPAPSSDDFATLAAAADRPAVYSFVGGGDPDRWRQALVAGDRTKIIGNHAPEFLPDLRALPIGVGVWRSAVAAFLAGPIR